MGLNQKFCQNCGVEVTNYSTVCPNCQTPLLGSQKSTRYQSPDLTKRPLGVIIIVILLSLGTILDSLLIITDPDIILIAVFIFRLIAIVGLLTMKSWGFWVTIALYSIEILVGFADITIFLENNIRIIADINGVSPSDPEVRTIIQSSLIMGFLGTAFISSIILYYLSRKKSFFI